MTRAIDLDANPRPARKDRRPFRLSLLEERWSCSRMSVWRARQDPRFPRTFSIGSRPYVWLDELEAYEEALATATNGADCE